jgi:sensor histidine kinase YesM
LMKLSISTRLQFPTNPKKNSITPSTTKIDSSLERNPTGKLVGFFFPHSHLYHNLFQYIPKTDLYHKCPQSILQGLSSMEKIKKINPFFLLTKSNWDDLMLSLIGIVSITNKQTQQTYGTQNRIAA